MKCAPLYSHTACSTTRLSRASTFAFRLYLPHPYRNRSTCHGWQRAAKKRTAGIGSGCDDTKIMKY